MVSDFFGGTRVFSELILIFASTSEYRRPKVFENILVGKKTVSNLFWGLQYGLLPELGFFHGQNYKITNEDLSRLKQSQLITINDKGSVKLTELGGQKQRQLLKLVPPLVGPVDRALNVAKFKDRFLLASQVTSEYSYQNAKYFPVSIQLFDSFIVKKWFKDNKSNLPQTILAPLTSYLNNLDPKLAEIFAKELVGHQVGGQTYQQIAAELQVSPVTIELITSHLYANLANYLILNKETNLVSLLTGLIGTNWTTSAQQTYQLFINQDASIDNIASLRSIKPSTVREHLLESAIWLPITKFPYSKLLREIGNANLSKEADFFAFRLQQIYRSKLNG